MRWGGREGRWRGKRTGEGWVGGRERERAQPPVDGRQLPTLPQLFTGEARSKKKQMKKKELRRNGSKSGWKPLPSPFAKTRVQLVGAF